MIAHAGADLHVLLVDQSAFLEVVVCGLDDLLRLDASSRSLHIAEGVVFLPRLALLHPSLPLCALGGLEHGLKGLQNVIGVRPNRDRGSYDFAECRPVDVDVNDATCSILLGCSSLGGILVHDPCGSVVKSAADGDDAVGVLDCEIRVGGSVHAQHVHGEGFTLIEYTHRVAGGRDGDLGLLHHLLEDLRTMVDTLANVEDRSLGLVDHLAGLFDLGHVDHGGCIGRAGGGSLEDSFRHVSLHRDNVLGQIDVHRAWSAGRGDAESLIHCPRQLVEIEANKVPLCARPGDFCCWALLECICAHCSRRHLTGEDDHGNAIRQRVLHGCHQVSDARTAGHDGDTELPRGLRVGGGGVP
mmetsp:Transcript_88677/g.185354  ORF Transcript_88677/g.185354 Transcript_88677/m.185354 type:complete len:356 (-) Transcript_88677:449-1516(-)